MNENISYIQNKKEVIDKNLQKLTIISKIHDSRSKDRSTRGLDNLQTATLKK